MRADLGRDRALHECDLNFQLSSLNSTRAYIRSKSPAHGLGPERRVSSFTRIQGI